MEEFLTNGINPYSSDRCKDCPNKHYCSMNRLICKEYQEYLDEWRKSIFNMMPEGENEK